MDWIQHQDEECAHVDSRNAKESRVKGKVVLEFTLACFSGPLLANATRYERSETSLLPRPRAHQVLSMNMRVDFIKRTCGVECRV